MSANQITFTPEGIAHTLNKMAFFLIIAGTSGQIFRIYTGDDRLYGLIPLFNLDWEKNLPSFFSMFILISASALLTIITILEKKRTAVYASHWKILAFGFLYMACDEGFSFHEKLTVPIRAMFGYQTGFFYFAWVIPGILLVLLLAVYFTNFLLHLSARTRKIFLLAGSIYLAGALGMELIGGRYAELHGLSNLIYLACVTIEEGAEMIGVIIFIQGLLEYIADNFGEIEIKLQIENNSSRNSE